MGFSPRNPLFLSESPFWSGVGVGIVCTLAFLLILSVVRSF